MRTLRLRILLLPLFATGLPILYAQAAQAQTIPSPYRFIDTRHGAGGFAGVTGEDRGSLRLGPGGGFVLGARYGFDLTGPLAFEGTLYTSVTDREVYDPRGTGPVQHVDTVDAYVVGLDARARFTLTGMRTWYGLAPFLIAGGGLARDFAGRAEIELDFEPRDRFTFGPSAVGILGAGTRWFPSDRLSLRIDGTLKLWRLSTPPSFQREDEPELPTSEWTRVPALLVGASLRF